jgi:hypothetical protein
MELLSILNWKTDSSDVAKVFHENLMTQMTKVEELVTKLEPGDYRTWDLIIFAYLQLVPGLLNANVHAQVRTTDLLADIQQLNLRLEGLTKRLIWLTVALVFLTIVLLVVALVPLLGHTVL